MLPFFLLTFLQAAAYQAIPREEDGHKNWHRHLYQRFAGRQGPEQALQAKDFLPGASFIPAIDPPPRIAPGNPIATAATVPVQIIVLPSATAIILPPAPAGLEADRAGLINTTVDTQGRHTQPPLLTDPIPSPSALVRLGSSLKLPIPPRPKEKMAAANNIFGAPISTGGPAPQIPRRNDHPVPRLGIGTIAPISTNKFYANFFLGGQNAPTYTHPYSLAWAKGKGASASWGMAISHVEASQRVYGKTGPSGAASYFINPVGIQSIVVSALELGSRTTLTSDLLTAFSARVALRPEPNLAPAIQFPLVQGMGFVTAVFNGASPVIQTGVFFKTVTKATRDPKPNVSKFKFALEDGSIWLMYAQCTSGNPLEMQVVNNGLAKSKGKFYGTVQVAKDPGNGEALYDSTCGAYPTTADLTGTVDGLTGVYNFNFKKAGMSDTNLIMYALPHHVASFSGSMKNAITRVKLQTTTKGIATAVVADAWTMVEPVLPVSMGFTPWTPERGSINSLSDTARAAIRRVAVAEISQNMVQQSNQNSMYFSGKALAKFASILIVVNDLLGDATMAANGLAQLKAAFGRFASNQQQFPLVYESAWGGVVSSATYVTGDSGADFGNTYYNDHHFHYGYFIYTAAVIARLDPSWLVQNRDYVNTLVRDVANPSSLDGWFPPWRNFDWYHGHSWAHGLYETLDGKDQESSSEDAMHAYAIKMWGLASGDENMAARGNLQLAVMTRSLNLYYLYHSSNTVQPPNFINNKVAGILFENKIDHTTYFGANIEYIQGIHMIPLLPCSAYVRRPDFVREEWQTFFDQGRIDAVQGGWRGILMANAAVFDPHGAWAFFTRPDFNPGWLDGGASLTHYLAFAAALGGA